MNEQTPVLQTIAATLKLPTTADLQNDVVPAIERLKAYAKSEHEDSDAFERALSELVDKLLPGLDSGDLLKDAQEASKHIDSLQASHSELLGALSEHILRCGMSPFLKKRALHALIVAGPLVALACEDCDGRGVVGPELYQGEFQPPEREECSSCHGSGRATFADLTPLLDQSGGEKS